MNRRGFTLVEILAVVALIAILSVAAIAGVTSIINRQRIRTATLSEKNINEAALSIQSEKHNIYLPACVDKESGTYVNITELIVKKINDDLRNEMNHAGKTTREQKEQFIKNYIKNINTDETFKRNFANDYLKVKDINCFKATSVADMIKEGHLKDLDNGCDTASLIIVYNKGDSANTAGNLKAVQETGICKGSESEEKGPLITVSPEKDLRSTAKKTVKITATANESNLESNLVLKYGWSKSLRKKPTEWETVNLVGDNTKVSAEVSKTGADEEFYLWIAAGSVKDDKGYSNVTFAAGPYAFLPTPVIGYLTLNEDPTFPLRGGKRCDAEITCRNVTQKVVYSKPYGKDVDGHDAPLCEPKCKGYTFKKWVYKDLDINNNSIVKNRNDHDLTAIYDVNSYTLTYDNNGGSGCGSKTVTFDEPYGTLCSSQKRTGYTPKGWWTSSDGGTEVTSSTYVYTDDNHKIYAHWDANPFNIAYNGNNESSGSTASHQCIYDKSCNLKNNGYAKTDYTFNGWKKDNTGTALKEGASIKNVASERNATVTYYAQWCRNCAVPSHGACTLDASTVGTCKYTTSCNKGYSISNNGKYNPSCTPNTFTVAYKGNGATGGSTSSHTCTYDAACSLASNGFSKTGYAFLGWKKENSGSTLAAGSSIKNEATSGTITYYAQWGKLPTCSISVDSNPYRGSWYKADVGITMTTSDATSYGLSDTSGTINNKKTYTVSTEGNRTYYGTVKNANGSGSCTINVKLDKSPPIIVSLDDHYYDIIDCKAVAKRQIENAGHNLSDYSYYNGVCLVWRDIYSGMPYRGSDLVERAWFTWPSGMRDGELKDWYIKAGSGITGPKSEYIEGSTDLMFEYLGYNYKGVKKPEDINVTYHLCDYVDNCVENTVSYRAIR